VPRAAIRQNAAKRDQYLTARSIKMT